MLLRLTETHSPTHQSLPKEGGAKWDSWQTGYQGKYSIERLMAMDNYYRTTSMLRVLLVCVATPLPALLIAILIELIPLQSPHEGAFANWGFWIRHWVTLFIMIMSMTTQVRMVISTLPFTTAKCLTISFISSSIFVAVEVLVGGFVVFPIPFMCVLGGVPCITITCITVLLVIRLRPSSMDPVQRTQLQQIFLVSFYSGVLLIVYTTYSAVFAVSETKYQSLLIVVLQIIKLVAKNVVARALSHFEDYVPESVVLLVEVFNALYLTTCMQVANSIETVILIFGLDCALMLWEIHEVKSRSTVLERLIQECLRLHPGSTNLDFLAFAIDICSKADKLHRNDAREISLRAHMKHNVSPDHAKLLEILEAQQVFNVGRSERQESHSSCKPQVASHPGHAASGSQVAPLSIASLSPGESMPAHRDPCASSLTGNTTATTVRSLRAATVPNSVRVLQDTLQSLDSDLKRVTRLLVEILQMHFHIEYIVLVEYVEYIVPFVYVMYSAVRFRLPSDVYYPHSSISSEHEGNLEWSFLFSVVLYTGFDLVSFVILNALYWWKFRFLPLYQLAFVLENQLELVQSKLVLWIVFLLQFELYHYGKIWA